MITIVQLLTKEQVLYPSLTNNVDGEQFPIQLGIDFGYPDQYVIRKPDGSFHLVPFSNVKEAILKETSTTGDTDTPAPATKAEPVVRTKALKRR